jgi:hypothetical protein
MIAGGFLTMIDTTAKRRLVEKERVLLDFARSYLSDSFPNPDRQGCPPDDVLRILARQPTQSDKSLSDHVTCCSPCFKAYMDHLGYPRDEVVRSPRVPRDTWSRRSLLITASALVLVAVVYVLFIRWHNKPMVAPRTPMPIGNPAIPARGSATAMYVPVLIDLSKASPVRGVHEGKGRRSPQLIPSSPLLNLNLVLPLGSEEGLYSVRLSSNGNVVWSRSVEAKLENGQVSLRMLADFGRVVIGNYDLVVVSQELRLTVPVRVKSVSDGDH